MSVAEVLNKAADLLEKPGAWTRGTYARDSAGQLVASSDHTATCWCAMGATIRAAFSLGTRSGDAIEQIAKFAGDNIGAWNDAPGRTQAEVVAALRQAAKDSTQ